jgi:hypothetical protein
MGRAWRVVRVVALSLVLCAGPVLADDDDDGGGGGGGAGSAGGTGAASGASGGDGGSNDPQERPRGAPSTGSFSRDLRGFLGSFGVGPGLPAPPAPAPPPPRQSAPQPARAAAPATSVANEITALGVDAPARARLLADGYTVLEEAPAEFLPGSLLRLRPPRGVTAAAARDRARALAPAARIDLTHLYRPGAAGPGLPEARRAAAGCAAQTVGVVDTGIDPSHPALAGRTIEQVTRRAEGRPAANKAHGTAVVALLAQALGEVPILVVDAFHRRPDGDAADAFDIAAALGLLAARGISVVNLSFAGPANEVLALATERAASRGMLMTAAAGNDGPRSPPRYPAAYPWVVAVTAVDAQRRPFVRAGRGAHLAFAAPGVGLPGTGRGTLSGTSYAVPFVTAAFAHAMAERDRDESLALLSRTALDLGVPGRDPVFGWGLIRADAACGVPGQARDDQAG